MSFLNPDRHSVYECQKPIRLSKSTLPLDSVKRYVPCINTTSGEVTYRPRYLHTVIQPMYVRCRHCDNCRRLSQRQWQARLAWYAKTHTSSFPNGHVYFVTLTFDPDSIPEHLDDCSQELATYKDVQLFIQNLRDGRKGSYSVADYLPPLNFKYFAVGEFGDSEKGSHRFHYHLILFVEQDYIIPDYFKSDNDGKTINCLKTEYKGTMYPPSYANPDGLPLKLAYINSGIHSDIKKKKKKRLQTGREATLQYLLSSRWKYGIVSVGSCDTNGAFGYLTSYCTASIEDCEDGYRPFHRQSLGIGAEWFEKWHNSIYAGTKYLFDLDPFFDKYGVVPIPAYYMKKFGNEDVRIQRNLSIIPDQTKRLDELLSNK